MKKKFYYWLWKKLYNRVVDIEFKYAQASLSNSCKHIGKREFYLRRVDQCLELENHLNYLKDEIIAGDI